MNLILNGLTNPSNIITFNNVPTILKVDSSGSGDKARLEITVSTGGNIGEKCYITVNGYTITSTNILGNDVSSVYLVPLQLSSTYTKASSLSIIRAFQNTGLINNYNIYADKNSSKVIIEAKEVGNQYNFTETDTNATYISFSTPIQGSSSDLLNGSKVTLDVYAEGEHLISVDKNYYKNGINFDLSPILATVTENGNVTTYDITAYYTKNGQTNKIGNLSNNYAANGYSVNQGKFYIPKFNGTYIAQNMSRGTDKGTYNNTTLYYINNEDITLSFYCADLSSKNLTISYLDSALNTISTSNVSFTPDKMLYTYTFTPKEGAYYIDVVTQNQGTVRYTNVKPLKYGNTNDYQVLYYYNSYGGVSFFPFTGKREEERETEKTLYKKQNFNIYTDNIKGMNKVYSMNNEYSVTLTTHYMEQDGVYSLYDLMNSYEVWTEVNGEKYEVIIDELQVSESDISGVWQGSVTYKYSSPDKY
jgi:hypothetical protein